MKKIVYTRHDGGVSICIPTDWSISMMGCGGLWDDHPRGFMDVQIERQIARGVQKDAARRYARAMQFGGCTTAEALEIIRDRDCAHLGTAIELWDAADIPRDRWFRDAWRRSHNGGPITVDLEKARPIQWGHIKSAYQDRLHDLYFMEFDLDRYKDAVVRAGALSELRTVWPKELVP